MLMGYSQTIGLLMLFFKRFCFSLVVQVSMLPNPYGDCVEQDNTNQQYYQKNCLLECEAKRVSREDECGCQAYYHTRMKYTILYNQAFV